ncbi:MAG: coproporphyrinogen-III oxidase family protein [Nannocystaceae bacterium]
MPFCARACPYCDFDFKVQPRPEIAAYLAALEREVSTRSRTRIWAFDTVYVGGGTPSTLGAEGLYSLLSWIDHSFVVDRDAERTVELNPEHIDGNLVASLLDSGVTRVSLGVQTVDPGGLNILGRVHDENAVRRALTLLVATPLEVSLDLIVGWPGQTSRQLERDLSVLISSGSNHVSVYALTVEEGARWNGLVRRGLRQYPDPDRQADLLEFAAGRLTDAGFEHYEISNFARASQYSRHNNRYWTGGNVVGLGPSAASTTCDPSGAVLRERNVRGYEAWRTGREPEEGSDTLAPGDAAREALWLGLRKLSGVDTEAFLRRFSCVERGWIDSRVRRQVQRGNLEWDGAVLRLAPGRWLWHDEVGVDLLG